MNRRALMVLLTVALLLFASGAWGQMGGLNAVTVTTGPEGEQTYSVTLRFFCL